MLAYAASRPRFADRKSSPNAMLGIIAAHVALVAVVMSAKMELPPRTTFTHTVIDFIPLPAEPPRKSIETRIPQPLPNPTPNPRQPDQTQPTPRTWDSTPLPPGPDASTSPGPQIDVRPNPIPVPQPTAARLLTSQQDLKPPYPPSKLLTEQEAVLELRLTIDSNGRVIAVDPVGAADRVFLEAARRHIMAHWRYRPATEEGRSVATSTVITLEFRLDG